MNRTVLAATERRVTVRCVSVASQVPGDGLGSSGECRDGWIGVAGRRNGRRRGNGPTVAATAGPTGMGARGGGIRGTPRGSRPQRIRSDRCRGEIGVRDHAVPHDRLEGLRDRRDEGGVDRGDDDDVVAHPRGVAALATDDSEDRRPDTARVLHRLDQLDADATFKVAAAHGQHEDRIIRR